MKIFLTGLISLHWGRLEFGNIGNYYIISPLFEKLHEIFPNAEIVTTFQLSDEFSLKADVKVLPLNYYYGWQKDDLDQALKEYSVAMLFEKTGSLPSINSDFINTVLSSDLVINIAGDMWGDNCISMGSNRFLVELLKMRTVQLLKKKNALFASSPGPVNGAEWLPFAKEVYSNFDLVANRENYSRKIMELSDFDVSKTINYACPSFLFNSSHYPQNPDLDSLCHEVRLKENCLNVGFIMATYALPGSSFDAWERSDKDFEQMINLITHIVNNKKCHVILLSHSNGFELPPNFKPIPWRDHKMIEQLYAILVKNGNLDMNMVSLSTRIYQPWEIHALIGKLDLLVSGRVHGSVAGLEQYIPTMALDYKNGPLTHKMFGFFELVGMERYVVPRDEDNFIQIFDQLYDKKKFLHEQLKINVDRIRQKSLDGFDALLKLVKGGID